MAQIEIGTKFGRWTVIGAASPAISPSQNGARARARVRCVCGHEAAVFGYSLAKGTSTGCPNRKCAVRYQIVQELKASLDASLARGEELDEALTVTD